MTATSHTASRPTDDTVDVGYGFAYAAWIRTSEIKSQWCSEGYHYYLAFRKFQHHQTDDLVTLQK